MKTRVVRDQQEALLSRGRQDMGCEDAVEEERETGKRVATVYYSFTRQHPVVVIVGRSLAVRSLDARW